MEIPDLSVSDIALLHRMARGWDTARIAADLGRTVRAVRADVRRIRQVLGASNDISAVVVAVRAGLI